MAERQRPSGRPRAKGDWKTVRSWQRVASSRPSTPRASPSLWGDQVKRGSGSAIHRPSPRSVDGPRRIRPMNSGCGLGGEGLLIDAFASPKRKGVIAWRTRGTNEKRGDGRTSPDAERSRTIVRPAPRPSPCGRLPPSGPPSPSPTCAGGEGGRPFVAPPHPRCLTPLLPRSTFLLGEESKKGAPARPFPMGEMHRPAVTDSSDENNWVVDAT